jgi:hypothetical protein
MGLTVTFVLAHILSLTAFGAFAGLLPTFFELWGLSSSEAATWWRSRSWWRSPTGSMRV